jgi:hypothetical protein
MKNIFLVILGLMILVTSMGFTLSSHICRGKRVKTIVGVVTGDVSCGMEKVENNCVTGEQMKSDCCQDEFQKIQNDNDYTQRQVKFDTFHDFAVIFIDVFNNLLPTSSIRTTFYKEYSPPPIIRNIPVMVQSFLI